MTFLVSIAAEMKAYDQDSMNQTHLSSDTPEHQACCMDCIAAVLKQKGEVSGFSYRRGDHVLDLAAVEPDVVPLPKGSGNVLASNSTV